MQGTAAQPWLLQRHEVRTVARSTAMLVCDAPLNDKNAPAVPHVERALSKHNLYSHALALPRATSQA